MNILSILGDANMVAPVSTVAENITPTTADLNMWELSLKGGIIMIPLLILSILAI